MTRDGVLVRKVGGSGCLERSVVVFGKLRLGEDDLGGVFFS